MRPSISPIRSSRDLRARNGSSGWLKPGHRRTERAARPLGVADRYGLARPLSHRQALGAGSAGGRRQRPYRRDRGLCRRRRRRARLSGDDPAQSLAVSRARARLCLSRLWQLLHAECLERDARDRRRRPDQGARAARRRPDHAAQSRRRALARPGERTGKAHGGVADRSFARRARSLPGRPSMARRARPRTRRNRGEHQDRHFAGCGPPPAILSSGQSIRQRSEIAQRMGNCRKARVLRSGSDDLSPPMRANEEGKPQASGQRTPRPPQ